MKESNKHIINLLAQTLDSDISSFDETFLNKSLQKRITETHCNSIEEYNFFLNQNPNEINIFTDSLLINYSEFFRNPLTFSVLERIILPSLISKKINTKKKEIRIWSAACAAGQEIYSIAMLLEEIKNINTENVNYRIFATDQSEAKIAEAKKGQYSIDALNKINLERSTKWFIKHGSTYTIKAILKKNIDFSVFDLLSKQLSSPPDSIFGDFDIVICANILFYYKNKSREFILKKINNSVVAQGGYIITGEAEREILMNYNYKEVIPQSAIFKMK